MLVDDSPKNFAVKANLGEISTFDIRLQVINTSTFTSELAQSELERMNYHDHKELITLRPK